MGWIIWGGSKTQFQWYCIHDRLVESLQGKKSSNQQFSHLLWVLVVQRLTSVNSVFHSAVTRTAGVDNDVLSNGGLYSKCLGEHCYAHSIVISFISADLSENKCYIVPKWLHMGWERSMWGWHTVEFVLLETLRVVCPYTSGVRFGYTLSRKSHQDLEFHAHTCCIAHTWFKGDAGVELSPHLFSIAAAIGISTRFDQLLLASGLHGMSAKFIGGLFVHLTLFSSPNLIGAAGWWPQRGCRQGPAAQPIVSKWCVSNSNTVSHWFGQDQWETQLLPHVSSISII